MGIYKMITIDYKGRLGNNIFQYILAKIISHHNNFAIHSNIRREHQYLFPSIDGYRYFYPEDNLGGHSQIISLNDACKDTPRHITLSGFFHVYDYYKNYKEQIIQWLNLPYTPSNRQKDIVLCVRGGDLWSGPYNNHHPPCPYSYYNNILENENFEKIWIVTENTNDIIANKIKNNWNGTIISNSVVEDFLFIRDSYKIVMALSTLSWWASWLSNATTIYMPQIGFMDLRLNTNGTNLCVTNEDRYKYIELKLMDDWAATPEQVEYILS